MDPPSDPQITEENAISMDDQVQLPTFDFSKPPEQLARIELDACCRAAKWSPDGQAILTSNEDRHLDVYKASISSEGNYDLERRLRSRQAAPIYETVWYPYATVLQASTFCFLASVRDAPVKLLDANDGRVRASYKIIDHRERFVAPHSMAFNPAAQSFYCGFLDAIEVFDLQYPGEGTRLLTTPTKKSKDGLRGIMSSLAFCPDYSGLYAAGTFNAAIGLLSEDTGAQILLQLHDVLGAVTQLKFNPMQPNHLFASFRQRKEIGVWDVRNTTACYATLQPPNSDSDVKDVSTSNQRRWFDIDASGRWVVVGDEVGNARVYETTTMSPMELLAVHSDSVSTTAFNGQDNILLTTSGAHHFSTVQEDEEQEDEVDEDEERVIISTAGSRSIVESSMKVWRM